MGKVTQDFKFECVLKNIIIFMKIIYKKFQNTYLCIVEFV